MSWGRMRPAGKSPRMKPEQPPLVVLDEDDADDGADDSEVFIINDPVERARAAAACNSKKGNSSSSNVINLDDDDDDDDDDDEQDGGGGGDRAGPSTAGAGGSPATATPPGHAAPRNRYGLNYVSDSDQSDLSGGSDSDSDSGSDSDDSSDCEILPSVAARGPWEKAASRRMMHHPPPQQRKGGRASTSESSAESSTHHDENPDNLFASGSPLDDRFWEHYAFNPAGPIGTSGSQYGASPSSAPNAAHKSPVDNPAGSLDPDMACNDEATRSHKGPIPEKAPHTSHPPRPDETLNPQGSPLDDRFWEHCAFNPAGPIGTSGPQYGASPCSAPNAAHGSPVDVDSSGIQTDGRNPAGSLDPDMACNDEATRSHKGPVPEKAPQTSHPPHADETLNPQGCTGFSFVPKNRVFPACSADWKDDGPMFVSTPERMDDPDKLGRVAVLPDGPDFQDGLIGARERHKESDEYKRAQEEEWASRQRQLEIQAEEAKEAKRLRKRKKAEALRLLDMEKRQKQRVEEVRETQRKTEEDTQLKEQCRGAVRLELENLERTCRDVSSILRALGIPVEGGEVKGAYKRALLKFHPDRVSRTDIYQQVKAEETFKFISRFKEKLKL